MPGFFSIYSGTGKVDIGPVGAPGYWVEIKKHLTAKENKAARDVLMAPTYKATEGQAEATSVTDIPGYEQELLAASIVDWNLDDEQGQKLSLDATPVRQQIGGALVSISPKRLAIQSLPEIVYTRILERVQVHRQGRSTEEATSFRDEGAVGAANGNGLAPGAGGIRLGERPLDEVGA